VRADVLGQPAAVRPASPPPLGLVGTVLLFGGAAVLLLGATHGLIPALAARTGAEPVLLWFAAAGLGVLAPLLLAVGVLLYQEGVLGRSRVWRGRLRFRPMTHIDWLWSLGGLAAIGLLVVGCMTALRLLWGEVRLHPSFMSMEPLTPGRYWILGVWLPFWVLNIMAEEILWRGVVLPRQEAAFGRWAWLVNGAGWLLFHLPFGPAILLTLGPTTFILPYMVQRRQNSWTGVVIHAGLNGPAFVAVAFGFV
jgi:membrane protease YdiL (CAAX protease family)